MRTTKDLYLEAVYRVIFIGAENSIGFHNPTEAGRICGDAVAMAGKSDALLRQAKQWALADRIRDRLEDQGVILEDGKGGTGWRLR